MKALITGGAGFIGSHIQDKLISLGHNVAVVDNLRSGKTQNLNQKSKFYKIDIRNYDDLKGAFVDFQPEAIFHLAAQNEVPYSMDHPYEDEDINIRGMINILLLAKEFEVKKFIYSNTGGAFYGEVPLSDMPTSEDQIVRQPTSFYGVSKSSAELYLKLFGYAHHLPWVSLRYANVYGPRQEGNRESGVVAIFTKKLLKKEPPTIYNKGVNTRDYIHVSDVVSANIAALLYPKNDYFNISTGIQTSTIDVFNLIEGQLKTRVKPIMAGPRTGDQLNNTLSPKKAKKLLGWEPAISFPEGIKITLKYYLQKTKS